MCFLKIALHTFLAFPLGNKRLVRAQPRKQLRTHIWPNNLKVILSFPKEEMYHPASVSFTLIFAPSLGGSALAHSLFKILSF